jgi:hypothetical protein
MVASPAVVFWVLFALHAAGLASMFLARVQRLKRGHALCHSGFLACLLFVAAATLFTIVTRSDWWVWSGTVFSVMAVGATADLGPAARASGF